MPNRPQGRKTNITGVGKDIKKRGDGLGTGPVGQPGGYSGRKTSSTQNIGTGTGAGSGSNVKRSSGGGLLKLIIGAVVLLGGGGGLLGGLLGGGGNDVQIQQPSSSYVQTQPSSSASSALSGLSQSSAQGLDLSALLGTNANIGNISNGWGSGSGSSSSSNVSNLDTTVATGARDKRTVIKGNGEDVVTIMVYMCGTDLESQSGMATSDLQEMAAAKISDKVNLLVFTGGAKSWKNNVVSATQNQIYKVESGGLRCLVKNAGTEAMVSPDNLTSFIKFCTENYPANRNELIFWDHGGGSISGYGYDEKNARSGSMTLSGINKALSSCGTTFDFIGFDACLMATLENALTLTPYADYLIASEETEPGIGWHYTNWLTNLSANTSMPTLQVGQKIVDDFVSECNKKCPGQKTTLSVIDLAELEKTIPEKFRDFSLNLSELMQENEFKTVSTARGNTREFAASNKIDQIDLVHLAYNLDTEESRAFADALLDAVKYNRTSSNMTNAYGISIYFPYQKVSGVNSAVQAYNAIGLDSEYTRCIQQFASMEVGGQAVAGGSAAANPLNSLLGSSGGGMMSSDMIGSMLSSILGGGSTGISGLTGSNSGFIGKSLDPDMAADYLTENRFDADALTWTIKNGTYQMELDEEQWSMVHDLALNVFYDDGEGFIDLGLDNIFDFTDDGSLIGEYDGTWLAINDQPVAYYYMDTVYDGDFYTITGRIPVMLNGTRADLIVVFDSDNPYGYIAGARTDYKNGETETVAKSTISLEEGDVIEFLCDYYSYDGEYLDSYYLGDPLEYSDDIVISNVYINEDNANAAYLFTDIYCQKYWTPVIP